MLGVKAYKSISDIPEDVDLAVIVTPPPTIPGIIRECGENGVRGAIVISAGFKEIGPEGAALEQKLLEEAQAAHIRVIGPNCLGVMAPLTGMNATFATAIARPGSVGFISQSGALCTAVLDWSLKEMVGFSAFVSVGSMVDVGWGDLIYHLGNDPKTRSIVIYMESIGNARAFLSAAREVALNKPIIVIKPGRTAAAAKAAASHTGSLTGSDEVLEAAFRRSGVLRVNNIADLFYMAEVLSKQPSPKGPRLTIVTNAGGPGRAGYRRPDHGRRRAGRADARNHGSLQRRASAHLEPQQPRRYHRRRLARTLCQGPRNRRQGSQQRRHAGDPHPAGHDRSHPDRRAVEAATPSRKASRSWQAGWAAWMWRRARRS